MPSTSNRQASIDSRRIALEREVTIQVPRFDTFVSEYSTNISTTGMFIVSEKPHAPGTTFTFEFSVADDWKLIRGKAQVVWTRYRDEDKERPAGMGVRFVELDAQSRRLIRWIVEKNIREGGKPFELDELRNMIDEALEDVADSSEPAAAVATVLPTPQGATARNRPTVRHPAVAKTSPSRQRNIFPLVATAAVIVLGLVCLFWLTEWIPDRDTIASAEIAAVDATDISTDSANTPDPDEPVRADGGDSGPSTGGNPTIAGKASPPMGSAYASVREALISWSTAWSAQDVEGYLSAYSRDFKPNGSSLASWEALRRERLTAPEYIEVSISQLDLMRERDNLVRATFFQTYRSNRFSDSVKKVFELAWENGTWKILSEATR